MKAKVYDPPASKDLAQEMVAREQRRAYRKAKQAALPPFERLLADYDNLRNGECEDNGPIRDEIAADARAAFTGLLKALQAIRQSPQFRNRLENGIQQIVHAAIAKATTPAVESVGTP